MVPKTRKTHLNNQSNHWFMIGVIGLAVICLASIVLLSKFQNQDVSFSYKNLPYLGNKNAPVKIVEFGDYKCPICKNFNDTVFPGIDKELIKTGKASFYFMNDPFIYTDSTRSAQYAETVYNVLGNKAFWKFHDTLYSKQPSDSKYEQIDLYSTAFLEKTLKEVTSQEDVDKVTKAFKAKKYESSLNKDTSYVNKLSIQGTPIFFVNGKEFKGNSYQELVDMVIKAAKGKYPY
jgi:protein-disulfide isomerase